MEVVKRPISFDLESVVLEELPFMSAFYRYRGQLNSDVQDLLSFPVQNKAAMPFYTIRESSTYELNKQFELYYQMMISALTIAFSKPQLMAKYFDCQFLREHGDRFIPYAKYTFQRWHPALYGRFDACFDPETEELLGVYEFNGDTPVMLFESVNLQARFSSQLGTDQYNNWWELATYKFSVDMKNFAVVCGTDFVEDMATCETVAQAFQEAKYDRNVSFLDLKELDFDHMRLDKPFVARDSGKPLDGMYILSPWEEMISNFPTMLSHWERWVDNVKIFEPAWRWFLAHKGMTALCTFLMENDARFSSRFGDAKLIPTYLDASMFYQKSKCVAKPVVGRLSNNIRILNDRGFVESDTGGYYSGENVVYQKYMAPRKVEGRNNFILGMWMCDSSAASMCAREFDTEVLSISNERFIPHIVVAG